MGHTCDQGPWPQRPSGKGPWHEVCPATTLVGGSYLHSLSGRLPFNRGKMKIPFVYV